MSSTAPPGRDTAALGLILVCMLCASTVPVAAAFAGDLAPFLFNGFYRVGIGLGCSGLLLAFYRRWVFTSSAWALIRARVFSWPANRYLLLGLVNTWDYALLSWSTRYVDATVSVLIFDSWAISGVALLAFAFRGEGRYRPMTWFVAGMALVTVLGFLLALGGQVVGWQLLFADGAFRSTLLGLGLALAAMFLTGLVAFNLKWGADLGAALARQPGAPAGLGLCGAAVSLLVSVLAAAPVNLAVGFAVGEPLVWSVALVGFLVGLGPAVAMSLSWRQANLLMRNLALNGVLYLTPPLTLCWLLLLGLAQVVRGEYLVAGTLVVIVANVLVHFQDALGPGARVLLLGLVVAGACLVLW